MSLLSLSLTLALMTAPTPLDARPDTAHVGKLATRALGGDTTALAALRELGQPGLDVLRQVRAELSSVPPTSLLRDPRATAWDGLIDKVARQLYASESGLYWHTDLARAKAVAAKEGKAIVSLRLLGDLDDVLSCANSRFFRTLLYPDPAVRAALHDRFVLHWESVRKAPKIEIDFGDGRVLTRTITGNSLHYLMDAQGRVVDALPGLHGPTAFIAWLDQVAPFAIAHAPADNSVFGAARIIAHRAWHAERLGRWQAALAKLGVEAPAEVSALRAATTDEVIGRLATSRPDTLRLDATTFRFLDRIFPTAAEAAPLAITKAVAERPMLPWLRNIRGIIAQDEVQNDFIVHTAIHDIFIDGADDTRPLTARIYRDVFLTPLDDPFMGLAPADVFTAIPPDVEKKGDVADIFGLGRIGAPSGVLVQP